jgi:heme/copper-type cytochrome/quinol oxidase subunit 4
LDFLHSGRTLRLAIKQAKHLAVKGAVLGFCLALALSALVYYVNHSHWIIYNLDTICLLLAPTSLILMATDHATPSAQATIVLIFAFSNSILYAIVFFTIGLIWAATKSIKGTSR